jgi:hypothetical protein
LEVNIEHCSSSIERREYGPMSNIGRRDVNMNVEVSASVPVARQRSRLMLEVQGSKSGSSSTFDAR